LVVLNDFDRDGRAKMRANLAKGIGAIPNNGRESIVSQQQSQESLQERIDDYLRGNPLAYAVEEPKEESVEAIFRLLQREEEVLKAVQERIARLKWDLERALS